MNEREPTPHEPVGGSEPEAEPVDDGVPQAPADPDDPPADLGEPLNPA